MEQQDAGHIQAIRRKQVRIFILKELTFIDLFAGLGGFHQALGRLGHRCVFASELDPELANIYFENFGLRPHGDIKEFFRDVPSHDILCAGFPC